uniref:Uncharacterized protein n=1 Tax=Siphoviridae sp. ctYaH2 TaxID=2825549 RepID=A0A8S5V574_9CAUD|nr:MAG TPA: hypothetical protein [Siphoviridae sp. ctYaH2]
MSGSTVGLQWLYSGSTVALQWLYSGSTMNDERRKGESKRVLNTVLLVSF